MRPVLFQSIENHIERGLPRGEPNPKALLQFSVRQDRVARARSRRGILPGSDLSQLRDFAVEQLLRARKDGLSKAMPRGQAGTGHVIEAGPLFRRAELAGDHFADDGMRGAGQLDGCCRRADLIAYDGDGITLAG